MKSRIVKRILVTMLSVMMAVSVFPTGAFAGSLDNPVENEEEEVDESEEEKEEEVDESEEEKDEEVDESEEDPTAVPYAEDETGEEDTGNYDFEVEGISDTSIGTDEEFVLMDGVSLKITDPDNDDQEVSDIIAENYRVRVISVKRYKNDAEDTEFSFDPDNRSSFTAPDEGGYTYAVVYEVQHRETDAESGETSWVAKTDSEGTVMDFTRRVTVVTHTEVRDELNSDDEYIGSAKVESMTTGTKPFDETEGAGNDTSATDKIVRSFDTITYTLELSSWAYSSGISYKNGYIWFKFILPCSSDEAAFDTGSMGWISTESGYESFATTEVIDGTTCQVLYAARYMTPEAGQPNALPIGRMTVNLAVRILAMKNGDEVAPQAYVWMDHNLNKENSNPGSWSEDERVSLSENTVCEKHEENTHTSGKEIKKIEFEKVTVSAAPSYDVKIVAGGNNDAKTTTFDFSSGNADAINHDAGSVYGQADRYGLQISLCNMDSAKGLRGIELPNGEPITFDVTFRMQFKKTNDAGKVTETVDLPADYTPLVWSLDDNHTSYERRNGRTIKGIHSTNYLVGVPYNNTDGKGSNYSSYCHNGGTWSATQDGNTVHVTVSGYTIDPTFFPVRNAGSSDTTFTYYTSADAEGLSKCTEGVFAGGELEVVIPYGDKDSDNYLAKRYGSGTVYITVNDVNLNAVSVSGSTVTDTEGTNDAQAKQENDSVSNTRYVSNPGSYTNLVHYCKSSDTDDFNGVAWNKDGTCRQNGKDVGQVGQEGQIVWGGNSGADGFAENCLTGLNSLLKFDDKLLALDSTKKPYYTKTTYGDTTYSGSSYLENGVTETFLYAYKTDGLGWNDFDEMNEAVESDLVYYKDLSKTHGVCVGILLEGRTDTPEGSNAHKSMRAKVPVTLTGDYDNAGQVAAICISSTVWKVSSATGSAIPRRYDNDGAAVETPEPTYTNVRADYTKATYSDAGVYTGGHAGSMNIGDSLYIVPYKTSVSKFISQNANSTGTVRKTNFDLDNSQTVVDFEIDAATTNYNDAQVYENTTDVKIYDILPEGVSYIRGSSVYGGTYTQSSPVGYRGTVTGGETLADPEEVTVTGTLTSAGFQESSTGTEYSALVWTVEDVTIGERLKTLHYSVTIDKMAAKNSDQYENSCWITTDDIGSGDYRVTYGTFSHAGFMVTKNASMSMLKVADQLYVDAAADDTASSIGYTLSWQNTSQNPMNDAVLMDTMPSNGNNGSSYSGTWSTSGVKIIIPEGRSASAYSFFYTTDPDASTLTAENYTAAEISASGSGWTQVTVGEDGSVSIPAADTGSVTAWCIIGMIDGGEILQAKLTIQAGKGNRPGDCFNNVISYGSGRSSAASYIVDRKLSGLTWLDANKDGERSGKEKVLSGVKVALYQKNADGSINDEPYQNVLGQTCQTVTGSDGKYQFEHLGAGEFVVRFSNGTTVLEGNYYLTVQNAEGKKENRNSKAAVSAEGNNGTVKTADITGIIMPEAAEISTSPYMLLYQDAGFTTTEPAPIDVTLKAVKQLQEGETDVSGKITKGQFTFTLTDGNETGSGTNYDMPEVTEASTAQGRAGGAEVSFDAITINKEGTYTFIIEEKDLNDSRYTKDSGSVTAVVTVTKEKNTDESDRSNPYILQSSIVYTYNNLAGEAVSGRTNTFINQHRTVSVPVSKAWEDDENRDGKRPAGITIILLADGTETEETLTLIAADEWKGAFTGLEKCKADGTEIQYTVKESTDRLSPYALKEITGSMSSGFVVTNTYTPEKITVSGSKTWSDKDNQDGKRPTQITIRLKADNADTDKFMTVTKDNGWKWSFENLPKYRDQGTEIKYTVTEDAVNNYSTSYPEGTCNVENSYTPEETSITVSKVWDDEDDRDGKRPDKIVVSLYADEADTGKTLTLSEDNDWKGTFDKLAVYKPEGVKINYTVEENTDEIKEIYTSSPVEGDAVKGFTFTNKHEPAKMSIPVHKKWDDKDDQDGKRPESVKVSLYKNGETTPYRTVELTKADMDDSGRWSCVFNDLYVFEKGKEIIYTVGEEEVKDYTPAVTGGTDNEDGFTITNTHVPELVSVNFNKIWDDSNNADGLRTASIKVSLYKQTAGSEETYVDEKTVSKDDEFYGVFRELPKYEAGKLIVYTVKEEKVNGYENPVITSNKKADGTEDPYSFRIVNRHVKETPPGGDDNPSEENDPPTVPVIGKVIGAIQEIVAAPETDEGLLGEERDKNVLGVSTGDTAKPVVYGAAAAAALAGAVILMVLRRRRKK